MRFKLFFATIPFVILLSHSCLANDDEPREFEPGLVETTELPTGSKTKRISPHVNHDSSNIATSSTSVTWSGFLLVRSTGQYQFRPFADGAVQIRLGNEVIVSENGDKLAWLQGAERNLSFGYQPIEVTFKPKRKESPFSLFWSGPDFKLEPISSLYHKPDSRLDSMANVRLATIAFACASCHENENFDGPLAAPSLKNQTHHLNRNWLVDFLVNQHHGSNPRGPKILVSPDDARAIAAVIANASEKPGDNEEKMVDAGRGLFHEVGCLACHRMKDQGALPRFGGGDLTSISAKRPTSFFAKWLTEPSAVNEHHHMPIFSLTRKEVKQLSAYLASCGSRASNDKSTTTSAEPEVARRAIEKYRCHACHEFHESIQPKAVQSIPFKEVESSWTESCLAKTPSKPSQPSFWLRTENEAKAIREFMSSSDFTKPNRCDDMLTIRGCVSCHARGSSLGIRSVVQGIATTSKPTDFAELIPPSLNSVGDKLIDEELISSIESPKNQLRPWLKIRMPKFRFEKGESTTLAEYLVSVDRVPGRTIDAPPHPAGKELELAGARLVTADGFGCTSCHQIGSVQPSKAPTHQLGPHLSELSKRIRKEWFDRWLHNPIRIIPDIEMPSVQRPVVGVLQNHLPAQIDAIWAVLNKPGFEPPLPDPIRVVRHDGNGTKPSDANVITDVIYVGDQQILKPFAIGLANRHNILFDLGEARLAAWSIGDTARQRTKGKIWLWEWAGANLYSQTQSLGCEFSIEVDGQILNANRVGQFVTEPKRWEKTPEDGVVLYHNLSFDRGDRVFVAEVSQKFSPYSSGHGTGFTRHVRFAGLPEHAVVRTDFSRESTDPNLIYRDENNRVEIRIRKQSSTEFVFDYTSGLPVDKFVTPDIPPTTREVIPIHVAPGFEAVRLPIDNQFMPTGFAWVRNGPMYVTSLKGRVWKLQDADADDVEDSASIFSDDLAAPYGIKAYRSHVDVINKYGLLRLIDRAGDGKADLTELLASGWGHTADYHDWTSGMPRDEKGNYYVSTACQQDDRSKAAANLRGKILKLVPEVLDEDGVPSKYRIEPISAGHRFAMGIARSRLGHLFVTDNQGNYNPFNELNHVRPGLHYGFINEIEKPGDFNPPLTPPAINIPHPWTRSVNGICFLESPDLSNQENKFGRFEGHLIGCEYDSRRLVRMSLQRIGDTFQGGIYPLSDAKGSESLLGPVSCAISPRGHLYIGEMRDSGWGAGNNNGDIIQMRFDEKSLPVGICEIRAANHGFEIQFTKPVDKALASSLSNYRASSYTRISTPVYGGNDMDRRDEQIESVTVSANRKSVHLEVSDLREGYVYDFHLQSLVEGREFFPAEGYFTLLKEQH